VEIESSVLFAGEVVCVHAFNNSCLRAAGAENGDCLATKLNVTIAIALIDSWGYLNNIAIRSGFNSLLNVDKVCRDINS